MKKITLLVVVSMFSIAEASIAFYQPAYDFEIQLEDEAIALKHVCRNTGTLSYKSKRLFEKNTVIRDANCRYVKSYSPKYSLGVLVERDMNQLKIDNEWNKN